jgi:CheY-like chemotaxis protein
MAAVATEQTPGHEPVRRLHRIRVLLVASDRRYLHVAALLLTRRGCDVATAETGRDVVALVDRHRSNVLVVDATNSVTAAARTIAAVAAMPVAPHILAVSDSDGGSTLQSLHLLPKWTGLDRLIDNVESAYHAVPFSVEAVRA